LQQDFFWDLLLTQSADTRYLDIKRSQRAKRPCA